MNGWLEFATRLAPPRDERRDVVRILLAILLPAMAVSSGFTPLNHAVDYLSVSERPFLVVLTPSMVLAMLAVAAAVAFPLPEDVRFVRGVGLVAGLLVAGGLASLFASADPSGSAVLLISGVVAPLVFALALLSSDLPRAVMCWTFLLVTAAFLLRADAVFLMQNGLPAADTLIRVKFENAPYDFHYYSLGNPNYSSAFLVAPLALAAFWAADSTIEVRKRFVLAGLALIVLANLVLVYVRFTMVIGVVVVLLALLATPLARTTRRWVVAGFLVLVALAALNSTTLSYFGDIVHPGSDSSSVVRLTSIEDGLATMIDKPVTGVGLGRYGIVEGLNPAHSSIVQAGAEAGFAGALGVIGLSAACLWLVWTVARPRRWQGLQAASAIAAAVFCAQAAVAAGPPTWLASYSTAVWGLSLGVILAGARTGPTTERSSAWVDAVLGEALARGRRVVRRLRCFGTRSRPAIVRHRVAILACYGALAAAVCLTMVSGGAELSPGRTASLQQAVTSLDRGGPPLTKYAGGSLLAIDQDQGMHLVIPLVSHVVGIDSPDRALGMLLSGVFLLILAVSPVLWWLIWRSMSAALAAPFLVAGFGFLVEPPAAASIAGLAVAGGLPPAMALAGRSGRQVGLALVSLSAAAGCASLLSPWAGLPVLVGALIAGAIGSRPSWHMVSLLAAITIAYATVSFGPLAVANVLRERSPDVVPEASAAKAGPVGDSKAAVWQGVYFGLGWFHNGVGIQAHGDPASSEAPSAYLTPEAVNGLRSDALDLIADDPGFAVGSWARKALTTAGDAIARFPLVLIALPVLLVLGIGRRSRMRMALAPAAAALGAAWLAPALASPLPHFANGFVAAVGAVWLWTALGVVSAAERQLSTRVGSRRQTVQALRAQPVCAAVVAGAAAALALTSPAIDRLRINPRAVYEAGESRAAYVPEVDTTDASVSFSRGLPPGWEVGKGARSRRARGELRVETAAGSGYQLIGPHTKLQSGAHELVGRIAIDQGGLYVGILDVKRDRFLATARYSEQQSTTGPVGVGLTLNVPRPVTVAVVVGNWNARGDWSLWRIEHLGIDPSPPAGIEPRAVSRREGRLEQLIDAAASGRVSAPQGE